MDHGVKMVDNGKRTEADGVATYRIPSHADFLIAYRCAA